MPAMYMQKAGPCRDLGRSYLVALEELAADGQELLLHVLEPRLRDITTAPPFSLLWLHKD